MSDIWPHATPANPCPICQKSDWCCFGDKAMKCMRVESAHACPSGGWYHFYGDAKPDFIPKPKEPPQQINAAALMQDWRATTSALDLQACANKLGVHIASLSALGVAWAHNKRAWAFPMSDGYGNVCGIRLRNDEAFKWAVTGSRQGIFLPSPLTKTQPIVYLPEGPTDTAALLSLGLYSIGRPTNLTGNAELKTTLARLKIFKAVIVADNDGLKKLGNREGRPGIEGALKLKKDLGIPSVVWVPPTKDSREFVRNGGTRQMIENDVNNRIWSKQ